VFKAPVSASDYTLQTSARGKLFINLTPVVQRTKGDGSAVVPGSSVDLGQVDAGGQSIHAAPTAVPTSTPAPTNTAAPTRTPEPTQLADSSVAISAESQSPTAAAPAPTAEHEDDSAQADPGPSLAGRLGGSLADVRARFGEPSWTDTGLIGYNSVTLSGTDAILVVYYDASEIVTKFSIVYLERPVAFDDAVAIANVVAEVAPVDGSCQGAGTQSSGVGVPCSSAALATVFGAGYLQTQGLGGEPGAYSYMLDPIADEYFELVVQPGIPVASAAEQAPTATSSAAENAPSGLTSDFTADEIAYANEILRQTQTMADSLGRFAELTENVDIATVYTTEWQVAAAVELVIWQQTYQDALNLVPPPRFAAVHAKYLEGLSYISQSADEFAYGVDNFDIASIEQAAVLMNLGNEAILEASMELQAVLGT
jgi:hypothetical protein